MQLKNIAKEISTSSIVGVGESTHGTHEFFITKSELFIELVKNHGFNTLLFEDRPKECSDISSYIKTGEGDLKNLMRKLYPVWNVKELSELIEWLRDNYTDYPVEFIGFDIDQSKDNINKRDELMAKNITKFKSKNPKMKAMVWAHNTHIKVSSEVKEFQPMGMFLRKELGKDYLAIAQFFGIGEFSATNIDKSQPDSKDRRLKKVSIKNIPVNLLEAELNRFGSKFYYLSKEKFDEKFQKVYPVRSIGWGLVVSQIDEYVENCNPIREFDGLIYHPISHTSTSLLDTI